MKMSYSMPLDSPITDIISVAAERYSACKSQVFIELGLDFNEETETGRIRRVFPDMTVVAQAPSQLTNHTTQVVDQSAATMPGPAQQSVAAHLGNHVVPPTGEPDLKTGEPGGATLPDPSELTEWIDQCWYSLLVKPEDWYDTREDPGGADFEAINPGQFPLKGTLGAGAQKLYLKSKYGPAPAWVTDNLHLIGG